MSVFGSEMKKLLLLFIPFLLPAVALAAWLLYDQRQPPAWQVELGKYIAYQERRAFMQITAQAVDRAGRPWEFGRDPGYMVYGDTPYYVTDFSYQPSAGSGGMPLPYPPEELWCVLLKLESVHPFGSPKLQLVFVARHQDLYNAAWVVHAASQPADSPELLHTLAVVGCQIDVSKPIRNLLGSSPYSLPQNTPGAPVRL
jgi:hypothetical protein